MGSLPDALSASAVVLDASAVINLLGSGKAEKCLKGLAIPCLIEERTFAEIKRHPIPGLCHVAALDELERNALLSVHRMTRDEYEIYLSLVSGTATKSLDDGESAAIAIAVMRGCAVVLDDRKARRVHRDRFPSVQMSSSLRLFIAAGERAGWPKERIAEYVEAARRTARMNIVKGEEGLLAAIGL